MHVDVKIDWPLFWRDRTPAEIAIAWATCPPILGPWRRCEPLTNLMPTTLWRRDPVMRKGIPCARITCTVTLVAIGHYLWTLGEVIDDPYHGSAPRIELAQADVDAAARDLGIVLLDDEAARVVAEYETDLRDHPAFR